MPVLLDSSTSLLSNGLLSSDITTETPGQETQESLGTDDPSKSEVKGEEDLLSTITTEKSITAVIRKLLSAAFDDEELTIFCYDDFRPVYDKFASGTGRSVKIQLLIDYCVRYGEINKLLNLVKENNPSQYENFFGSPNIPAQPPGMDDGSRNVPTQPPGMDDSLSKSMVEVTLKMALPLFRFTLELRVAVIGALADTLNIRPDQINIMGVRRGSIILYLAMPKWAADQLITWYQIGDPVINDLGIQKVREIDFILEKDTSYYISPQIREKSQDVQSGKHLIDDKPLTLKTPKKTIRRLWIKLLEWLSNESK